MNKLYQKLILQLQEGLFNKADSDLKPVYNLQKANRDLLVSKLAKTVIDNEIDENRLVVSKIKRYKITRELNQSISDIISSEATSEQKLMRDILIRSAIDSNGINSYVANLGMRFDMKKLTSKQIDHIVSQKIKGKVWDDRLWTNKAALEKTLRKEVSQLLKGETDINSIEKVISRRYNQNAYNTKRLVSNEVARVQSTVNDEFAREHQVHKQMFMATLDDRTSDECESYDGEVFDIDDPRKPSIPLHINCRSVYVNIIDDWSPTYRKDNRSKEVGKWSSYQEWLSDQ